jgi:hypothetical protein
LARAVSDQARARGRVPGEHHNPSDDEIDRRADQLLVVFEDETSDVVAGLVAPAEEIDRVARPVHVGESARAVKGGQVLERAGA